MLSNVNLPHAREWHDKRIYPCRGVALRISFIGGGNDTTLLISLFLYNYKLYTLLVLTQHILSYILTIKLTDKILYNNTDFFAHIRLCKWQKLNGIIVSPALFV
jgi:hypothetical protein